MYIALLRAVNVGGTGKLPMADLRSMAEEIGFRDVRTYIQSGNLVFESDAPFSAVRLSLEERLENYAGKPVGVLLRTTQEVWNLLRCNPFPNAEPNKVGVLFLNDAPKSDTLETAKGHSDEVIELGVREIYIHFPSGMGKSKLRLRAMADGTMRNLNTVTRLAKMAQGTSG
ncbi:MAG: DUF1697 domain-containing protein [Roseovarius sp.]|jgi:uncharacterized protein (DUF1697 family)|nr:DUF1697 domain-containing protein [Roseovarius sp.]